MKGSSAKVRWVIILSAIVVVFGAVYLLLPYADQVLGPAEGWYYRTFKAPAVTQAAFVEDLDPQHAAAQVEKMLAAYKAKHGSYGLRRTTTTLDGSVIGKCLVTEDGVLTYVADHTRDKDSNRMFSITHPSGLGPAPTESEAGGPPSPRQVRFYLISYLEGRGVLF